MSKSKKRSFKKITIIILAIILIIPIITFKLKTYYYTKMTRIYKEIIVSNHLETDNFEDFDLDSQTYPSAEDKEMYLEYSSEFQSDEDDDNDDDNNNDDNNNGYNYNFD